EYKLGVLTTAARQMRKKRRRFYTLGGKGVRIFATGRIDADAKTRSGRRNQRLIGSCKTSSISAVDAEAADRHAVFNGQAGTIRIRGPIIVGGATARRDD